MPTVTTSAPGPRAPDVLGDDDLRGYSARDPEGNLWSFGTAQPS